MADGAAGLDGSPCRVGGVGRAEGGGEGCCQHGAVAGLRRRVLQPSVHRGRDNADLRRDTEWRRFVLCQYRMTANLYALPDSYKEAWAMRILLVHPNYHSGGAEIAGNWPPAWVAYLTGYLKAGGYHDVTSSTR